MRLYVKALMDSCVDADPEIEVSLQCVEEGEECDLHDWSRNAESLTEGFMSQGDAMVMLRRRTDSGVSRCGWLMAIDQSVGEELVSDYTTNETGDHICDKIYQTWSDKIGSRV
jgi:hypothetical protein